MNAQRQHCFTRTTAILLGCVFLSARSLADDTTGNPDSGNAAPVPAPINFQVLQTIKIDLGNRSVIYNLVAPPLLPTTPAPDPIPPAPPPTADQISALQQQMQPPKQNVILFFLATVYDRQVTQLRWSDENGEHVAYSNLDLNFYSGRATLETADTSYFLLMALSNSTRDAAAAENVQVPPLSQFDPTRSQYVIAQDGSTPPTDASVKWLDAMHAYFDANKQQMIDSYNASVAAQAAQAQWLLDHPPVPQDTVINLWPMKSTNYQTNPQGGQQ
jgi:hypothetical protein